MNTEELEEKVQLAREAMHDFLQKMGEKYSLGNGPIPVDQVDEDDQSTWTFHIIALGNASRALWRAQIANQPHPAALTKTDAEIVWN